MEQRLYDLRVFHNWDVWFSADPNTMLRALAFPQGFSVRHPTLGLLVYYPLSLLSLATGATGSIGQPLPELLILLIAPVAAAVRTLFVFAMVRALTGRSGVAAMVALLDVVAFASLTVGSVPESFPLSAMCLAAMYWLVVDDVPRRRWLRPALWLIVATVAIGVTITNLVPVVVLLAGRLWRTGFRARRIAYGVAGTIAAAVMLNGALALGGAADLEYPIAAAPTVRTTRLFVHYPTVPGATEAAFAMLHTLIAPVPARIPGWAGPERNPDYDFELSFGPPYRHGVPGAWRAAVMVAVLGFGAFGFRRSERARLLVLPAALLLFNFVLHLFYGASYMLYALHWSSSLLFIVAGLGLYPPPLRRWTEGGLAAFVALTALNSWLVMRAMLQMLDH